MGLHRARALVVGAGAAGLRTSLELVRRNIEVVLKAPVHPLKDSCSQGSGGLWMPFHCDDPKVSLWGRQTLDEIFPIAQDPSDDRAEIVPAIYLRKDHNGPTIQDFINKVYQIQRGGNSESEKLPSWTRDERLKFQHLTVEMLAWQNIVNNLRIPTETQLKEAGYLYAWFFHPPVIDAPKMIQSMMEELTHSHRAELDVETGHYYNSMKEIAHVAKDMQCNIIVNCTGTGAQKLAGDSHLVPARGFLHVYDREHCERIMSVKEGIYSQNSHDAVLMTEEEPWGSNEYPCYMIPRGNRIFVGGSYLENDASNEIRDHEKDNLLRNARHLGIDTGLSKPIDSWVGFRPYRSTVRCELDVSRVESLPVVHNYGYGGSGWTINIGVAQTCADIVEKALR